MGQSKTVMRCEESLVSLKREHSKLKADVIIVRLNQDRSHKMSPAWQGGP